MNTYIAGTGTLPPGGYAWWFMDGVDPNRVRWFQVVPVGGNAYVDRDQSVEVTEVYHLEKGTNHASEGPNVPGECQANYIVHNLDPNNECLYGIIMAET